MDEYQIPVPETPSPPNPQRRRSRWLLPTIILSSVLVVFLVILGYGMIVLMKDSGFKGVVGKAKLIGECEVQLSTISAALGRYQISQGRYPASLESLYPEYLPSRRVLRCPADPADPKIGKSSYSYTAPRNGAPGDTVVCVCKHHSMMKDQPIELHLLKSGKITPVARTASRQ
jgi:hypothetical protein